MTNRNIQNTIKKLVGIGSMCFLMAFSFINSPQPKPTDFITKQYAWADSVLNTMNLDQKVGQLFMIATYSNRSEAEYATIERYIQQYHIGGVIFFQGNPIQQAILTNRYQAISSVPLLIGIDAEWGLGMRLDNAMSFPHQITLGAIQDDYLVELMGEEIGRQCKRLGIHINFAPVADINTNPDNPVINYRSFGEDKNNVAEKAMAYARGLRNAGIMASAKHFPGHGDTDTDSHNAMPVVSRSENELWNNELYPFQSMISDSLASVMTGHLFVPSIDNRLNRSGTVSSKIVTELLQNRMGFQGLTITDALNMRGLTNYYKNGDAELEAYKAGNDILLQTPNLSAGFSRIKNAFLSGELDENELNSRIHKILRAKYWAGLHERKPVELMNLLPELNSETGMELKNELYENAITVVRNDNNLIPFVHLDTTTFASISISPKSNSLFEKTLSLYADFKHFTIPFKPSKDSDWEWVAQQAAKYKVVVIGVHDMNALRSRNYGVSPSTLNLIERLSKQTKVIVCAFGNPYGLRLFTTPQVLICGYEDEPEAHRAIAPIVFGGTTAKGKLPITARRDLPVNTGIPTPRLGRLAPGTAESVGMDINKLKQIDEIAQQAISQGAFPGCQVLVARRGTVVYQKGYGNLRYGMYEPVTNETIYDLASVTKVAATLQAVMLLNERGDIDFNQTASYYLPELIGTNKQDLLIGEILLHQAGLRSFVPFWINTKSSGGAFRGDYYSFQPSPNKLQVAENIYIEPSVRDSVWNWLIETPLNSASKNGFRYVYSDLGLIMLQKVVEQISNQPLDMFVEQNIYEPLGMTTTLYNPLRRFPKEQIAPTEYDQAFRGVQIQGTVHDPNAAVLGGVAGHAGLFSSAWDLAKLLQMNLQRGIYGGRQYLFPETVHHFSQSFSSRSHRGLGWNKPTGEENSSVAAMASPNSYGHTGFTGTVVWVDPDQQLIFILLSNRVYPNANNNKITNLEIRRRMHEAVYRSLMNY